MRLTQFVKRLHEPVSAQSLTFVRIVFGVIMVWEVWRYFRYDRIHRYYVEPEFFFTYYGFEWVKPIDPSLLHYAWLLVGVFALLVALGLLYRLAIVGFTILFCYFFLLDKAQYLNHFYMVILIAGLLCLLPANRAFSLDARLFRGWQSETVPRYSVWALRTQMEIILIYAGLVKISEDWLRLEPLGMWMREYADDIPLGQLLYQESVIGIGAYGTIILHVLGAPLLLFKLTRLPVFVFYCLFHVGNAYFFNIGIFPWLAIAATTIFLAPNWPQEFARWVLRRFEAYEAPSGLLSEPAFSPSRGDRLVVSVLLLWIALQVLIPLRSFLYPSEVRWTGEGHRFSWRMRIYDREARGHFEVVDQSGGQRWEVDPEEFLTSRQAGSMMARPDMIVQFAHYLERVWAGRGYDDVEVYAHLDMSLNGREYQPLIKSEVDLTTRQPSPWRAHDYVTNLTTPFTPWAERQRATYDGPRW